MHTLEDSITLAEKMVQVGVLAGKPIVALVSGMDQPLGTHVGNALEVKEAIDTLNGKGPEDLRELCICLGSLILTGTGKAESMKKAADMLNDAIESGRAIGKFREFVKAQGGLAEAVNNPEMLPESMLIEPFYATCDGYIKHMDCEKVGLACLILGGGRYTKESVIDLSVGLELKKKVSDEVKEGDVLAYLYANDKEKLEDAREKMAEVYEFSSTPVEKPELIRFISRD
jgi:pyrimidine-nucleoside phosphorylase